MQHLSIEPAPDPKLRRLGLRRLIRFGRAVPARLAYRISNIPLISDRIERRFQERQRDFALEMTPLEGIDAEILKGLRENGCYVTSLQKLGLAEADAIVPLVNDLIDDCLQKPNRRVLDSDELIMVSAASIVKNPQIFNWALNERLLNIAEAYLGVRSAYDGLHLFYTPADGKMVATRRWHRDREDRRMMKMAVYTSDVDADGAAFQMIVPTAEFRPPEQKAADGARIEIAPLGPDHLVLTCVGPVGTVVFADTAHYYHRAKPTLSKARKAAFFHYISEHPRNPFFCDRARFRAADIRAMTEGLSARQQQAALWREKIPMLIRSIPTEPV